MKTYIPSELFKALWEQIIEDLLYQSCKSNINYCVKSEDNADDVHILIAKKFEEYKSNSLNYMLGDRIDRHKIASCVCAAIIEVSPLVGYNKATIIKNANEIIGLYSGLNVIKYYMMNDITKDKDSLIYLKENFDMGFPSVEENICDTKSYRENMENALYRSHHKCNKSKDMCFHFDIWAYAKIFYHLELYNKDRIVTMLKKYDQNVK